MIVRGLLSIIFLSGIAAAGSGPLSPEENEQLQKNCGTHLRMPSGSSWGSSFDDSGMANETWLLTIRPKNADIYIPKTTAFLISPRHIMTSAQVVLADNETWRFNGEPIKNCCPFNSRKHGKNNDVPKEALDLFEIWDPVRRLEVEIVRGRLFYLCLQNNEESWVPLIMEISEVSPSRKFPCYITEDYTHYYRWGDWVHSYGIGPDGVMLHRKMQLSKISNYELWFLLYMSKKGFQATGEDRGGPLVRIEPDDSSGKALVIGIKESDVNDYNYGVYYFQLGFIQKEVCEFSGVCWKSKTTSS